LSARIVVVIPHDVIVATLVESGALTELSHRHPLVYLTNPALKRRLEGAQEAVAPDGLNSRLGRALDAHFWNLSLFAYYRRHALSASTSLKGSSLPRRRQLVYRTLAHPLPSGALSFLDRKFFFAHDRAIADFLRRQAPRLVIAPASAMDSYSHFVVRTAASLGIPSAMLVSHWDYFSKKGLLRVDPRRIYVWGDDMRRSAIEQNGVDPARLEVLGAPQFDKYLRPLDARREAVRRRMEIEPTQRLLLFPGTSAPFDERAVLATLDATITHDPALGRVRLLYRPHPRAWPRKSAREVDPARLPNVRLDDPSRTSDEHYLDLMAAIDAVVSPFSTMTLEAALCGKPSLCIGFSDQVNDWDFSEATNTDHIRSLGGKRWLTVCTERARVGEMLRDFVVGLDEPRLDERIRAEVRSTVFYNERSYAQRLADRVQTDFGDALRQQG
jgi:hypothetical protein